MRVVKQEYAPMTELAALYKDMSETTEEQKIDEAVADQ